MAQYKVPREIQLIANRALDYNRSLPQSKRAAYKDEGNKRVPGTGMKTARRLASGSVSGEQIQLMVAWFARHSQANADKRRDRTSKMAIAWALWGGTPAQRWAKRIAKQIKADENR